MHLSENSNIGLKLLTNDKLTDRLEKLVKTERKITGLILAHINETERRRLFAVKGYSSMFDYLTKGLGYDESGAYRRLQAARLLRQVPEISEKLDDGSLKLSQLSQVQTALKQEKKHLHQTYGISSFDLNSKATEVLAKIENKTQKQTQGILAQEFSASVVTLQKEKIQKDESVRLEVTFSKEQMETLQKAKKLCSHQNPSHQWADLFVLLAEKEIRKRMGKSEKRVQEEKPGKKEKDEMPENPQIPEEPKMRSKLEAPELLRSVSAASSLNESLNLKTKVKRKARKYISVKTKRQLFKIANYRCQFQNSTSQQRCNSKYYLEVEHIQPVARGGTDEQENLRVYCREHNNLSAVQMGIGRQSR